MENSWRKTVERSRGPPAEIPNQQKQQQHRQQQRQRQRQSDFNLNFSLRYERIQIETSQLEKIILKHANCSINSAEENRI